MGHDLPVDGSSSPGLLRLHRLSLSLLTHFLSPSCWKTLSREAGRATEEEEEGGRSSLGPCVGLLLGLQIVVTLVMHLFVLFPLTAEQFAQMKTLSMTFLAN